MCVYISVCIDIYIWKGVVPKYEFIYMCVYIYVCVSIYIYVYIRRVLAPKPTKRRHPDAEESRAHLPRLRARSSNLPHSRSLSPGQRRSGAAALAAVPPGEGSARPPPRPHLCPLRAEPPGLPCPPLPAHPPPPRPALPGRRLMPRGCPAARSRAAQLRRAAVRSADRKEGGREEREGAMEAGGGQREERAWRAARGRSHGRAPPGAAAARDGGGTPRDGPPGTAPPGPKAEGRPRLPGRAQRRVPAAGDAREVFAERPARERALRAPGSASPPGHPAVGPGHGVREVLGSFCLRVCL